MAKGIRFRPLNIKFWFHLGTIRDIYVSSSFSRTLPNIENFAFENLTHHKGLMPECAELSLSTDFVS